MGDAPGQKPFLLPSFVFTNYNSQGMSRLYSYFSNLSACQRRLQNSFRPLIAYAISISRLRYFIVSFSSSFGEMRHGGPVIRCFGREVMKGGDCHKPVGTRYAANGLRHFRKKLVTERE